MKFNARKSDLVGALGMVERGLPTARYSLPITEGVLVEAFDNNLFMTSNNLEISVKAVIGDVNIEDEGAFILPRRFAEVVKRLPDETVYFETIEKLESTDIEVKCGKSKFIFHPLDIDVKEFPASTPEDEWLRWDKINLPALEFKEMLGLVTFALAKDDNKPAFSGVFLEIDEEGEMTLCGSDTHRMARVQKKVDTPLGNIQLLIPGKTLNIVSKMLEDDSDTISCYFSQKEVVFAYKQYVIAGSLLEYKYPNISKIFQAEPKTVVTVDCKLLESVLSRAVLAASKGLPKGRFTISDDTLVISTGDEISLCDELIDIEMKGDTLEEMFLNIKYITEPLRAIKEKEVVLEFNGNLGPCILGYKSDVWDYKYLVFPIVRG